MTAFSLKSDIKLQSVVVNAGFNVSKTQGKNAKNKRVFQIKSTECHVHDYTYVATPLCSALHLLFFLLLFITVDYYVSGH